MRNTRSLYRRVNLYSPPNRLSNPKLVRSIRQVSQRNPPKVQRSRKWQFSHKGKLLKQRIKVRSKLRQKARDLNKTWPRTQLCLLCKVQPSKRRTIWRKELHSLLEFSKGMNNYGLLKGRKLPRRFSPQVCWMLTWCLLIESARTHKQQESARTGFSRSQCLLATQKMRLPF